MHRFRDHRSCLHFVITGSPCACHPIMAAGTAVGPVRPLSPDRPLYDPAHPLGCHRPRIPDREHRNELIKAGIFAQLKKIGPGRLRSHRRPPPAGPGHRRVHHEAPGGGDCAGSSRSTAACRAGRQQSTEHNPGLPAIQGNRRHAEPADLTSPGKTSSPGSGSRQLLGITGTTVPVRYLPNVCPGQSRARRATELSRYEVARGQDTFDVELYNKPEQ